LKIIFPDSVFYNALFLKVFVDEKDVRIEKIEYFYNKILVKNQFLQNFF